MEETIPSFNEIIKTNRLINGRLELDESDLKKIYFSLRKDNDKLKNKLSIQENKINNHINVLTSIKNDSRRNSETINKSFYPDLTKISLLYKKQSSSYYIKARFYWSGKQREVQIGSIPIVINSINNLIENNILEKNSRINNPKITWESINKQPEIVCAIKFIASAKAQEYILRRIISKKIDIKNINEKSKELEKINVSEKQNVSNNSESIIDDLNGVEWYEKWREDNL